MTNLYVDPDYLKEVDVKIKSFQEVTDRLRSENKELLEENLKLRAKLMDLETRLKRMAEGLWNGDTLQDATPK